MLYDLSHLFFQPSSFHDTQHSQLIGIYGSIPGSFDKVFYVCSAGSSKHATRHFVFEWRMPPKPQFSEQSSVNTSFKKFYLFSMEIQMKTSFSIGNEFQSKWHQERASRYSLGCVKHKLFVFTRVKGFLLTLRGPASRVSRHSCEYTYRLEDFFFFQRSCSLFLS